MSTESFSGCKERPGRDADPSPPSSAVVKKGYSYTSTPPMGRTACTEPQFLYKGALYLTVELYLYSYYGPYALYRASVPVQGCTLPYSRAIPLLLLWAVRPVQSLSACTRVHFTLQQSYTPTPPMGRTACTEPQCLYKGALYLTVVLYLYSPMGRAACTEPQCLYKGALYLTVVLHLYSPMGRTACTELQCLYKGALYLTL